MRLPGHIGVFILLFALAGCQDKHASITLSLDGEEIYRCDDATVSELTPSPGGWAFKCEGTSVYFEYETDDTPANGSIEMIVVNTTANGVTLLPAYHGALSEDIECAATEGAPGDRGPDPLPLSFFGNVAASRLKIPLAVPCAVLEVVIERP